MLIQNKTRSSPVPGTSLLSHRSAGLQTDFSALPPSLPPDGRRSDRAAAAGGPPRHGVSLDREAKDGTARFESWPALSRLGPLSPGLSRVLVPCWAAQKQTEPSRPELIRVKPAELQRLPVKTFTIDALSEEQDVTNKSRLSFCEDKLSHLQTLTDVWNLVGKKINGLICFFLHLF